MPPRPTPCDPDRLRRLLDDRLDEAEQSAMADHLAACDGCRRTLDRMAAGTHWWRDARAFLADHEPDPDHDATSPRAEHPEADDPLDFLAPSDDPAHLGRIGPYEVVDVIGRGGMGLVLKGLDPSLNRFVAIKVLAPELATSASARRRFAREGQAAAAICHDHVVAIHAVDASGGLPYLVMQFVAGKSLQDRIDGTGPLPVEEIVRIGMQAARGLEAAHAVGLIHRDVKPSNILLENGVERVKLVDFGLARAADDASLTQSGVVAGTPQYMSPEQAGGEPVDHRADLFSLGSVLYALCTGRPPFRAESTMAVLRRVSDDTPRPIRELNPEIPDWLEAIVARLHAKAPADRFQTSSEVALLLGRCLAYLREPRRGTPPPYAVDRPKKPRRRRLAIAAVGLLALVALGAAGSDFVATVLRIRTADGTIVIRVNDPDVKVKVDDQDVVITGAGPQELRVKPGMHTVESAKGGRVATKIVTVERGGKQSVEVGFEPDPASTRSARRDPTDPRDELARRDPVGLAGDVRAELEAGRRELARVKSLPRISGDERAAILEAQIKRLEIIAGGLAAETDSVRMRPADASHVAVPNLGRPSEAKATAAANETPLALSRMFLGRIQQRLARERASMKEDDPLVQQLEGAARAHELRIAQLSDQAPPEWATNPRLPVPAAAPSASSGPRDDDPWIDLQLLKGALTLLRVERDGMRSVGDATPPAVARRKAIEDRIAGLETEVAALEAKGGTSPRSAAPRAVPSWTPVAQDRLRPTLPGASGPTPGGPPTQALAIAFGPDGRRVAVGGGIVVWPWVKPEGGRGRLGLFEPAKGTTPTLAASPGMILAVAFSPDGKTIATGEAADPPAKGDGLERPRFDTAKILDASTGAVLKVFPHADDVNAVAFSPDGRSLATASEDGQIAVFDVASGRPAGSGIVNAHLGGANVPAAGLSFAPDGRRLFAWTRDGGSGLWTFSRSQKLQPDDGLQIKDNPTACAAFSPDGASLAIGSRDGSISVRDVRAGQPRVFLRKRGGAAVTALSFLPDGRMLASAGSVGVAASKGRGLFTVELRDVVSRDVIAHLDGPSRGITSVAFAPDGMSIAAGSVDGTIRLWDVSTLAARDAVRPSPSAAPALDSLRRPALPGPDIRDLAFPIRPAVPMTGRRDPLDPDGDLPPLPKSEKHEDPSAPRPSLLPRGGRDPSAPRPSLLSRGGRREPLDPGSALPPSPGLRESSDSPVRPTPDVVGADPLAKSSRAPSDALRPVSPRRAPAAVPAPEPGEDSRGLAVGRRALPDGARPEGEAEGTAVLALATAPDGKTFATGSEDGAVRILDVASRKVLREFSGHTAPVRSVAYSPDGKALASASSDKAKGQGGEVLVRTVADGRSTRPFDGKATDPLAVAFSPDGATLAVGSVDGTIALLRLPTGPITTLRGHHGKPVRALAFAPDGKALASGGDDGAVEVWKPDGSRIETLPGNGSAVVALAYSPDGKRLAAGGGRFVILHDGSRPGAKARTPFVFRECEVLSLAFSPDGKSLAAAGGNVAARDGLGEVGQKIRQLEEARAEKEREVTQKRNAIAEMSNKNNNVDLAEIKRRGTVSAEEYRQLSNELLRVQIEIVKAEAQLAGLQNEQPAAMAPEDRQPSDRDVARIFYADKRVVAIKEQHDRAKDRYKSVKEKVRDVSDPMIQKPLKDMADARTELDELWRELKPEIEAMVRRGRVPDKGLKAAEGQLAAQKAQEASLTERLNALNIKQRVDGAAALNLEFARLDLNRAEQYLDTINRSLAELKFQVRDPLHAAEAFQSWSELRVWDVASTRMTRGLFEPGGWINALAFARDGLSLIAGGGTPGWSSGTVTLFDLAPRLPEAAPDASF